MTIESRVEEANCFPAGGPERARLEKDLLEFDKLASQLGEQKILDRQRFGLVPRRSIGKSLSEMAMVKAISGATDGNYSLLMYRLASSILHDNDHGQLMHYRPGELAPDVPLDEFSMAMQFDVQAAGLWFGSTAMTMIDALHDFTQHQGGDTEDVVQVVRLIGGVVRELLEARRAACG